MSIIRDGLQSADLDVPITSPTLNLDFANSQVLDPRITFSRGSIGTRVNRNGLIEVVPANQPRFDYDPISGECKGLLIEEGRTNLFPSNNALSFFSTNSVSTGDFNPDGTSATLWVPNSSGTYHGLIPTTSDLDITSLAVGGTVDVTTSLFAKNYGNSNLGILIGFAAYDGVTNRYYLTQVYPHSRVVPGTPSGIGWSLNTIQVIPYPNGWYRYVLSGRYTKAAGYNTIAFVNEQIFSRSTQQFWTGDNSSGIYIWGIQREQGRFASSYIPTSGSTVTRSTDILDILGSNFTNSFGNTSPNELSVFFSGNSPYTYNYSTATNTHSPFYWVLTNDNITERIDFRYAGLPQVIPILNGVSVAGGVFPNASQINDIKSVALIDNKSFAIIMNDGSQSYDFTRSTRLSRMPFGFTRLRIGSGATGGLPLNGTIRKLTVYPKRLSFSQATYLTQ